jgi:hypothetical protein
MRTSTPPLGMLPVGTRPRQAVADVTVPGTDPAPTYSATTAPGFASTKVPSSVGVVVVTQRTGGSSSASNQSR